MDSSITAFEIPKRVYSKLHEKSWIFNQLSSGKKVQQILGYTDLVMEDFYKAAYHLYEQGHYEDAEDAFFFLVVLNSFHSGYWLGYGSSMQHRKDYESAISAYEMAAICEIENPIPYLQLAKCLFAIHERESALQAIDLALEYSEGREEFVDVYHQALSAKALLQIEGEG